MNKVLRLAVPLLLLTGSFTGAMAGRISIDPPTVWPHTDVPGDPAVTFGTLPNGMRYLIQRNTHPDHGVSVYLRIATGSFDEIPAQAGISHFIEHMIFRGTSHIPDGDVFKRLQALGLATGADANASTGPEATIYTFNFPNNDATTLDTAFTLTRDIASNVLFDPKAVDSERQVVLSELRLRDTAQLRMARAGDKIIYGEELADAYFAIGNEAALNAATADSLKAFYATHYRPERAVLIVVGDIDVKAIEAEIQKRFSDWKATSPRPQPPRYDLPDPPKTATAHLYVENGANSAVQLLWLKPYDPTPETKARDERDTVREIAFRILNLRLHKLAASADPPYLQAGANAGNSYRSAFVTSLAAGFGTGDPKRAIKALHETLATILRDGVSQDEVDRAIEQQRTALQTTVTAAPTRVNHQLAGHFLGTIASDSVIDSPDNWTPTFEAAVKGLTAARVSAELRQLYVGEPLLIAASPAAIDGGSDGLLAAYRDAATPPVAAAAAAPVVWPYVDFGPAGTIKTQKTIAAIGVTEAQLANGVRVTIKPTKFQEGQLQVLVRIGHGRFATPKDKAVPLWALPGAWGLGGVNRVSLADMPQALNGKEWGASANVGDISFQLHGQTRPADLDSELQVLMAYVTDPAWRPEALAKVKSAAATGMEQAMTTPGGVFSLHHWEYVHGNDKRWAVPSTDTIKATELAEVQTLIRNDLTRGPLEVVIVGDIGVDTALDAVKRTFGALAPREVDTTPYPGREEMTATGKASLVLYHKGKTQEAVATLGWKTTSLFPDPQEARILRVLEAVMRTRLFDEIRTKEGITYSPQTASNNSWTTPGWGLFSVTATVPAAKLADFYAAAEKVAADLATNDISADELERARGPLISEAEHARETNNFWIGEIANLQVDPRGVELITGYVPGIKQVTAADVRAAAHKYLKDDRALRMIVAPEGFIVPALP
jgi:zinc protease